MSSRSHRRPPSRSLYWSVFLRLGLVVAVVCGFLVPLQTVNAPLAQAAGGPTVVAAGWITTNTTWSRTGSPYVVTGELYVRPGATLTVQPGTVVKFMPTKTGSSGYNYGSLAVYGGQLVARGTADLPVVFTSGFDDSVGGDSNNDGGATIPQRGDWSSLSFGAPSKSDALDMPTSVIENVVVKYGGESSSSSCQGGAEVQVSGLGRANISRSEFRESKSAGLSFGEAEPGVGIQTVSESLFASSACGLAAASGSVLNNVFESTIGGRALDVLYPVGLQVYGNWLNRPARINPNISRADGDFRDNAFLAGVEDQPTNQDPQDLSLNWWGHVLDDPPTGCWDSNKTYIPEVKTELIGGSGCYNNAKFDIVGYFTKVLPALASAPPMPQVGVGGAGGSPVAVAAEQLFGAAGSGSGYGARPVGTQADPVNTAIGAFITSATDVALPSLGWTLGAVRSYTSADTSTGWLGKGWSFGYQITAKASTGAVVVRVGDGQRLRFLEQPDGSYAGAPGVTATLAGSTGGGWTLVTAGGLRHLLDANGRLTSLENREGASIVFAYDGDGLLQSATSGPRAVTFGWTNTLLGGLVPTIPILGQNRLASVTLPDGRSVYYGYGNGLLTTVTDLGGKVTRYGYDAAERLVSVTSPSGTVANRLAYDPQTGRVSDQWDAHNNHSTFSFDASTGAATMTDPRGGVWTDVYQGNVLLKRVDPVGASTSYEYNGDLQPIAATDPRGIRSTFGYTSTGDLATFQGPGKAVTTSYNSGHLPTSTVSGRGTRATFSYDPAGRLTAVNRPSPAGGADQVTSYTYDSHGQTTSSTDARGKTTSYAYSPVGDLTSITTPEGFITSYTYDSSSRLTAIVNPRGNTPGSNPAEYTTTFDYNASNQVTAVHDAAGNTTSYVYNTDGRLVTATDPKSHTTSYSYDAAGQLTGTQGPDPAIPAATTSYDANGNTAAATDTAGRTTSYLYDLANRPTKATSPLGSYQFGYDPGSNMTSVTDPAGAKTLISYNAANQIATMDYPGSTADVTYSYDGDGNRTKMVDAAGTTTYTYDPLDQLTKVTRGTATFTYNYDPVGNQTGLTYPDGTSYTYSYDGDSQLTSAAANGTALADYVYDPAGHQTSSTLADGTTATRTFDQVGRLTSLRDVKGATALLDERYQYDAVGNPTTITRGDGTADHYTYDDSDRLTQSCFNSICDSATDYIRWAYNAAGAITTETRPAGTTTNSYNTKGQLATSSGPAGTTSYSYNTLGQQTAAGTASYSYDPAGRMKTAATPAASSSYTYDGDGRRISSAAGGVTTNYLWEPKSYQLALERDAQNATIRRYSYGTESVGMTTGSGQNLYYHQDRLGSIRALTDTTGTAQASYDYEPYGQARSVQVAAGTPANPMQWAGQYNEPTGLYNLRARQYNPTTGQFTSTDPASAAAFSGTYTYAAANPMVYADGNGLWPQMRQVAQATHSIAGTVAGVAGTVAVVAAATGVGAPVAAVAGAIAISAGVVTAASSAYLAWDTCNGGKGSCGAAVITAAIDTATVAIPAGGALKTTSRGTQAATAAKSADDAVPSGPTFVGFADSPPAAIPTGATGPTATRGPASSSPVDQAAPGWTPQ